MSVQKAYDNWSEQYDINLNKTRDLEVFALQETLADIAFNSYLKIGCGTGKNTAWLLSSRPFTAPPKHWAPMKAGSMQLNSLMPQEKKNLWLQEPGLKNKNSVKLNPMKKLFVFFITSLLLFLFSCKDSLYEKDAIKINQEGIVFMNAGKYELALHAFLRAIKSPRLSKDSKGTIYRNIALTYNELEKKDSAIHFSAVAAKCYRKNSFDYLLNLAEVDILTGKTAIALARLLKAVKIDPEDMAVNNSLGLIYMGDYDQTLTDLDKALTYNSKAFEISGSRVTEEVLARTYYKMEDYEKSELHFEHLLENHPDIISYSLDMGMIKLKLKKRAAADRFFDKVLASDSSYKETINIFKQNNR